MIPTDVGRLENQKYEGISDKNTAYTKLNRISLIAVQSMGQQFFWEKNRIFSVGLVCASCPSVSRFCSA